jgi:DNA polymerase III delta prime subunit
VLLQRPLVVIAGPVGVGKTTVALRVAGEGAHHLEGVGLHKATVDRVRRRRWPDSLTGPEPLVLDGPVYLAHRPAAAAALQELVRQRADHGHRTLLVESMLCDGSMGLLMDAVPCERRVTLMLRFPGSRGRSRFARRVCEELGLPWRHARDLDGMEPWSYTAVREALAAVRSPVSG